MEERRRGRQCDARLGAVLLLDDQDLVADALPDVALAAAPDRDQRQPQRVAQAPPLLIQPRQPVRQPVLACDSSGQRQSASCEGIGLALQAKWTLTLMQSCMRDSSGNRTYDAGIRLESDCMGTQKKLCTKVGQGPGVIQGCNVIHMMDRQNVRTWAAEISRGLML